MKLLLLICTIAAAGPAQTQSPAAAGPPNINAASLPGADAGAQINAADTRLGSASGTIVYNSSNPSTATTPVVLRGAHALVLASPVIWRTTMTLPAGSSGQSVSCPALQTLDYPRASTWIEAGRTSGVSLHDCKLISTLRSGETIALGGGAMTRLSVLNNTVQDTQLLSARSTESNYAAVTPANSSSDLTVTGNQGRGTTGKGVFLSLEYTNRALVQRNTVANYFFGVQWWGGDSCVAGCTAGGNGAAENPRRTSYLTIRDNTIMAAQACIWGSMAQWLTITGNTCASAGPGTGDVGIDLEGTQDSTVTGNNVQGFRNGSLATFFLATRNVWTGNTVRDEGGEAPIGIHNSSQNPAGLSETFSNNTFTCAKPCATLVEATGQLTLSGNQFTNVLLTTGFNVSQVAVERNSLSFSAGSAGAIQVTSLVGTNTGQGSAVIRGNQVNSSAGQAAGTAAIAVSGTDFNRPQAALIDANVIGGASPFPVDIICAAVSGNSPAQGNHCTITNNTLASDQIVTRSSPNTQVFVEKRSNHCKAAGPC